MPRRMPNTTAATTTLAPAAATAVAGNWVSDAPIQPTNINNTAARRWLSRGDPRAFGVGFGSREVDAPPPDRSAVPSTALPPFAINAFVTPLLRGDFSRTFDS